MIPYPLTRPVAQWDRTGHSPHLGARALQTNAPRSSRDWFHWMSDPLGPASSCRELLSRQSGGLGTSPNTLRAILRVLVSISTLGRLKAKQRTAEAPGLRLSRPRGWLAGAVRLLER